MANSCPLSNWANNSMIVHARAPSALGPFTVASTALLPFHHNVGAALTAGSEYLIYSTGCVVWNDTLVNCTNSFDKQEITDEMVELAKFAKHHVPAEHELDDPDFEVKTKKRV